MGVGTGGSPSLCCLGRGHLPHLLWAWLTAHVPSRTVVSTAPPVLNGPPSLACLAPHRALDWHRGSGGPSVLWVLRSQ